MVKERDGRDRLLRGATALLGERGYAGTELRDVAERGDAPRGSIYHHFPGGKAQLAAEAATRRGEELAGLIALLLAEHGALGAIRAFAAGFRAFAGDDPQRLGCAVAAVAVAGHEAPELGEAAARTFARWEAAIADGLVAEGVPEAEAPRLAAVVLSTVEGALLRARAAGDWAALDEAVAGLELLLAPRLVARRA